MRRFPEIALGVDLRRVGVRVSEDDLRRFEAELRPDLRRGQVAELVRRPRFDARFFGGPLDRFRVRQRVVPVADAFVKARSTFGVAFALRRREGRLASGPAFARSFEPSVARREKRLGRRVFAFEKVRRKDRLRFRAERDSFNVGDVADQVLRFPALRTINPNWPGRFEVARSHRANFARSATAKKLNANHRGDYAGKEGERRGDRLRVDRFYRNGFASDGAPPFERRRGLKPDQNGRIDVPFGDAPFERGANALDKRVDIRTAITPRVFPVALNRSKSDDVEVANAKTVERRKEKRGERGAKTFGLLGRLAVFDVISRA